MNKYTRSIDNQDKYFIKQGYQSAIRPGQQVMFVGQQDSINASLVWQYEVYEYASKLIRAHNLTSVMDIGCGCAMKLKKLISPICDDITGFDEDETIDFCNKYHTFGVWRSGNLEEIDAINIDRSFDLIISADVIEHMVNPDKLLDTIRRVSSSNTLILLSTPERDATRGNEDMGPPANPLHAREWNFDEAEEYVRSRGFEIIRHFRYESATSLRFQRFRNIIFRRALRMVKNLLLVASGGNKKILDGQILLLRVASLSR
ncbi:MAG: methyltransferase domain-containing protein [Methylococcaceae bacterium]|nr:methyltransferase domain-containing protein [Methylococcaceae bacterium]